MLPAFYLIILHIDLHCFVTPALTATSSAGSDEWGFNYMREEARVLFRYWAQEEVTRLASPDLTIDWLTSVWSELQVLLLLGYCIDQSETLVLYLLSFGWPLFLCSAHLLLSGGWDGGDSIMRVRGWCHWSWQLTPLITLARMPLPDIPRPQHLIIDYQQLPSQAIIHCLEHITPDTECQLNIHQNIFSVITCKHQTGLDLYQAWAASI